MINRATKTWNTFFSAGGEAMFSDALSLSDIVTVLQYAPLLATVLATHEVPDSVATLKEVLETHRPTSVRDCNTVLFAAMLGPDTGVAKIVIAWVIKHHDILDVADDPPCNLVVPAPGAAAADIVSVLGHPMVPVSVEDMIKQRLVRRGTESDVSAAILEKIPTWTSIAFVYVDPDEMVWRYNALLCALFSPSRPCVPPVTVTGLTRNARCGTGESAVDFGPAIRGLHKACVRPTVDKDGHPVWSAPHGQSFLFLRLVTSDFITLVEDTSARRDVDENFRFDYDRAAEAVAALGGPPVKWKIKQDAIMKDLCTIDASQAGDAVVTVTNWNVVDPLDTHLSTGGEEKFSVGKTALDDLVELHDAGIDEDAFSNAIVDHNLGLEDLGLRPDGKRVRLSDDDE